MANPVEVNCPANEWTLVAQNVTAGSIKRLLTDPNKYLETYRMTGGDAPTGLSEGAEMFLGSNQDIILSAAGIDVYIYTVGKAGKVRVDIP
jgi:hypothetical protein